MTDQLSIADLVGPWAEPNFDSGLVARCRDAWNKPLRDLTNGELATLLNQSIAVIHLLPVAGQRIADGIADDTEMDDGELARAIEYANKSA